MERSINAWSKVLIGWGIEPSKAKIRATLATKQGTYPGLFKPHSKTVYNASDVHEALTSDMGLRPYAPFWRNKAH